MKRKILTRGLLGFPLGVFIGYAITIFISLGMGGGSYLPCVPSLVGTMGSETGAVVLQAVLSGLLGSSFAAASLIWEVERWSIVRQTGLYFLITALTMLPVAYFAEWMEHTLAGFLFYFGIFVAIFAVVWICEYFVWKRRIQTLNRKISDGR